MNSLDYWRLADELSVINCAILITGNDPSERIEARDANGDIYHNEDGLIATIQKRDYEGMHAVLASIKSAIISNRISAFVVLRSRNKSFFTYEFGDQESHVDEVDPNAGEGRVIYSELIRLQSGNIFEKRKVSLESAERIFFYEEPDWERTSVEVEDLKIWLKSKGINPSFFFPKEVIEGFRDQSHLRYSPKLAFAVAAWEAVNRQKPSMSAKATLEEWIRANASRFGMVNADGVPSAKAVEETAAVANWATSGGAVPTATRVDREETHVSEEPIQNFDLLGGKMDVDEEIPF